MANQLLCVFYRGLIRLGQITIDGVSISQFSLSDLRDHIALVSQEAVLFDDTVAANIGFGRQKATDKDIRMAAKQPLQTNLLISCQRLTQHLLVQVEINYPAGVSVLPLQELC